MKVSLKVIGLEGVQEAIKDLGKKVQGVTEEEIRAVAIDTEKRSKENLIANKSVVTGTLLRSMTTEILPRGLEAEVGTVTVYAPYVELGTRRSRAKPYLGPAFETAAQGVDGRIGGKLEK